MSRVVPRALLQPQTLAGLPAAVPMVCWPRQRRRWRQQLQRCLLTGHPARRGRRQVQPQPRARPARQQRQQQARRRGPAPKQRQQARRPRHNPVAVQQSATPRRQQWWQSSHLRSAPLQLRRPAQAAAKHRHLLCLACKVLRTGPAGPGTLPQASRQSSSSNRPRLHPRGTNTLPATAPAAAVAAPAATPVRRPSLRCPWSRSRPPS